MHGKFKPAAVLVPLVERSAGLTVLLTVRALDLPERPGQISFAGGRVEPGDAGPSDTALRETQEEIGLQRHFVTIAGYLDNYPTITGYAVTPVVGFVRTGFTLVPDQVEVSNVFEVPLDYVLDPANHRRRQDVLSGAPVTYYEILYHERRIWGATAGMLVSLYQRLMMMKSPDVARIGLDAMQQGRPSVVPGFMNKLAVQTMRLTPRRWQAAVANVSMTVGH